MVTGSIWWLISATGLQFRRVRESQASDVRLEQPPLAAATSSVPQSLQFLAAKLRPAAGTVCDPATCKLTPVNLDSEMKVELTAIHEHARARCLLTLNVVYNHTLHELCVRVSSIHCSCEGSTAALGRFYFLEHAFVTIEVLQSNCSLPMEVSLSNAGKSTFLPNALRILSQNRIEAFRAYNDSWLRKLKVAPKEHWNADVSIGLGESGLKQQREDWSRSGVNMIVVEAFCKNDSQPCGGTVLDLQRDPVATSLTNSYPFMSYVTLEDGNRDPILLMHKLPQPAELEIRCSARVCAWQLAPTVLANIRDNTKLGRLQKHAKKVVEGKRLRHHTEVLMVDENCRIEVQLPLHCE